MSKIIVFATPIFVLLIALEYLWNRWRMNRQGAQASYQFNDTINSLSLGVLSQFMSVLFKALTVGMYALVFGSVAIYPDMEFWTTWYGWIIAFMLYDLSYYWLHRMGHEVGVLWAAHVVHHQSQRYNFSTALRQTGTGGLLGWIFFLPMAVLGVPPMVFGTVLIINLLYGVWVHTEQIRTLGWMDRIFSTPSNHRVHHGVNDLYVDKNYGGVFVIWDRLFGTFQEETEPCVYGTRSPLNSWNPLWANLEIYRGLAKDAWHTRRWTDKLKVWLMPPGWQPADLQQSQPRVPFRVEAVQTFNPPMTRAQQWFAGVQLALCIAGLSVYLWNAESLTWGTAALWALGFAASLWALGLYMQGRLGALELLTLESAVLATAGAMGLADRELHLVCKPLTMVFAMLFVAARARSTGAWGKFNALLLLALLFSLGGDVFLMLNGYFIPGLASFLVAHLFYIALFKQGQAWFPSRKALVAVLAVGAIMYAVVWPGLTAPVMQVAVAAYVTVISLMVSQAVGRAVVVGDAASRWVAVGTVAFMCSDSLIAINKFVTPVADSAFWILGTYYLAQMLIVHFSLAAAARAKDSSAG